MKKCLAHRSAETWSAATRRCLAQKAATSRRTPQAGSSLKPLWAKR